MNQKEAAELLGYCSGFDNRKPSVVAAIAWAAALYDVPLDQDAKDAVAVYYTTSPRDPETKLWILPHHVRSLRVKIRSKRLENFQYEPVGDETVGEFMARYRGQLQAIASGRVRGPGNAPALTGGPNKQVAEALEGVGRTVPDTDEEAVIDAVRRSGPLGVECPTCGAVIGRPCKTPGGTEKQPLGKPRASPHSARLRAARGQPEKTPEQREAEEQRIRDASRRHLARLTDEPADA